MAYFWVYKSHSLYTLTIGATFTQLIKRKKRYVNCMFATDSNTEEEMLLKSLGVLCAIVFLIIVHILC